MAKATKPAVGKSTPETSSPKTTRVRETVLVKVTATWLKENIGADTDIGVSRKELKAIIAAQRTGDVLASIAK